MQIKARCQYCGVVEYIHVKYEHVLNEMRCAYCDHDKLDFARSNPNDNIDYYAGCPPFPEKEEPTKKEETKLVEQEPDYGYEYSGFYDMAYGDGD